MLQKEEKTLVVLLTIALISISALYFGFFSDDTGKFGKESKIGDHVYTVGKIESKYMTRTGSNLIINLEPDIMVFIPEKSGAAELDRALDKGDTIRVNGIVADYKGKKEIVVKKKEDVIKE